MSPIKYFCADCKHCSVTAGKLNADERAILNIKNAGFELHHPQGLAIILKTLAATELEAPIYSLYLKKLQRLKRSGFKCRKAGSFTTPIEQACSMLQLRRGIE